MAIYHLFIFQNWVCSYDDVYLSDGFLGQLQRSYLNNLGSREKCGKVREKGRNQPEDMETGGDISPQEFLRFRDTNQYFLDILRIKMHFFFFYWAVFNKNQTDCLIDSYNFCNSEKITASSSGPISVYRWFWCIYFRYLEQCRKEAVLVDTYFRISPTSQKVYFWKIYFWNYAVLQ